MVELNGAASTELPVELLSVEEGVQVYDEAPDAASVVSPPIHIAGAAGDSMTEGSGRILTVMESRSLSQAPIVWLTYHLAEPTIAVDGVGATELPTPPMSVVYHNKDVPVATNGTAVAF